MIMLTINEVPGKKIEAIGVVKGCTVQAKSIGSDFVAGLRGIVGGEVDEYTSMIEEARCIAEKRITNEAEKLNADAIIGVRYTTSSVMQGASEILIYGTAVKFV